MKDRLTRITTRGGDAGETGLADGTRRSKTSLHFHALGDIDELNCAIGVVVAQLDAEHELRSELIDIQSRLFDVGGSIALPRSELVLAEDISRLEEFIAEATARLGPLANFVLPGGTPAGAATHLARAVCRRAERSVWELLEVCPDDYAASLGVYLNRLSDALFVIARRLNEHVDEQLWQQR
jgi:cob(I)alamin adenosyltransferase